MPRVDRLATLYLFQKMAAVKSASGEIRIPVLMYHDITDRGKHQGHDYFRTDTPPKVFERHMQYLCDNEYTSLTVSQAIDMLHKKNLNGSTQTQQRKYVVLTFDDGYRDFYTDAFPILQRLGFQATVFLPTRFINPDRNIPFKRGVCLTWQEARELRREGVLFGSHTVSHVQMKSLPKKDIALELRESKKNIEDNLGEDVESFSYPYAFPDEAPELVAYLREELESCGYRNGVSTRIGTATNRDDRYFIRRLPVNGSDDVPLFKAKLEGGYDWLNKIQYLSKLIKKGRIIRPATWNGTRNT